jgi:cytochrome c biogenesis protein CcmG, thiol:disulfide interchange protein DsbE
VAFLIGRAVTPAIVTAFAIAMVCVSTDAASAGARIGHDAPELTLPDWHGREVSLSDHRGHVVVLDFWATWCVPCIPMLPALDDLARRHAAAGVRVLAIDIDQSRAKAEAFLREHLPSPALTLLSDPDGAVLARYGTSGMPAAFVIDAAGIVRFTDVGYSPESFQKLEDTVRALLPSH